MGVPVVGSAVLAVQASCRQGRVSGLTPHFFWVWGWDLGLGLRGGWLSVPRDTKGRESGDLLFSFNLGSFQS